MPYTIRQAARAKGCSTGAVHSAVHNGDLPADWLYVGGQRVAQIAESDLATWTPRKRGRKPKEKTTDE